MVADHLFSVKTLEFYFQELIILIVVHPECAYVVISK